MDVVVIGEPLVEFSAARPLTEAVDFRLSFSGDALNAAVAAAAAGAHVALVTRVGRDEFGERLVAFAAAHGVDTRWMRPGDGPTGAYAVGADPTGERAFAYLRAASAASRMTPAVLDDVPLDATRVLLVSGITAAISPTCDDLVRQAVRRVRESGGQVVYDPNFRSRLTTAQAARATLAAVAPQATLLTPSCPATAPPSSTPPTRPRPPAPATVSAPPPSPSPRAPTASSSAPPTNRRSRSPPSPPARSSTRPGQATPSPAPSPPGSPAANPSPPPSAQAWPPPPSRCPDKAAPAASPPRRRWTNYCGCHSLRPQDATERARRRRCHGRIRPAPQPQKSPCLPAARDSEPVVIRRRNRTRLP